MPTQKVAPQKTPPKPIYVSQTYSVDNFFKLCQKNVVELVFNPRGNLNKYKGVTRRMLCTLNPILLNSEFGKITLKFKPPTQSPPYNAKAKGLVTVWDIFRQDWRNVPVKAAYIMPPPYTMPAEPVQDFIDYFDKAIKPMTLAQRMQYIND
jgi:hypothetical protein